MPDPDTSMFAMLPLGLEGAIRDANPWWRGDRQSSLPPLRRWLFPSLSDALERGLAPAQALRGPRQVGKTTLLNQIIEGLLSQGVRPQRLFRLQFDELPGLDKLNIPILDLARWYSENILRKTFQRAAQDGERAYIFLDEVQNLADWAPQLKYLVDMNPVRVLVTGSSALRIEAGRDSLAGRISTFDMGPLLLREIGALRGFGLVEPLIPANGTAPLRDKATWRELAGHGRNLSEFRRLAFRAFSQRGA